MNVFISVSPPRAGNLCVFASDEWALCICICRDERERRRLTLWLIASSALNDVFNPECFGLRLFFKTGWDVFRMQFWMNMATLMPRREESPGKALIKITNVTWRQSRAASTAAVHWPPDDSSGTADLLPLPLQGVFSSLKPATTCHSSRLSDWLHD